MDWRADVARARGDVATALSMLNAITWLEGPGPPSDEGRQYIQDARRLTANATEALERVESALR